MQTFSIRESVRFGYGLARQHTVFFIGITFILGVLQMIVSKSTEHSILLSVIAMVFIYPGLSLGFTSFWISVVDGAQPSFDLLTKRTDQYLQFIQITLLYQIIVALGFVFLIIPGIYLSLKYLWASYLVLDKHFSPMEALKRSGEMTKGQVWHLFKFILVILGINICGALFFGIGLLFSIPVTMITFVHVYRKMIPSSDSPDPEQPAPSHG